MLKITLFVIVVLCPIIVFSQSLSITTSPDTNICYGGATELSVTASSTLYNKTLSFDGINDYIQVGDNPELKMSNKTTLEAWVFPTGIGSSSAYGGMIINKEGEYEVARFPDGIIKVAFSNKNTVWQWIGTGIYTPLHTWSHIAITYDSGIIKCYLNGELKRVINETGAILDSHATFNDLRIGGRQGGDQYFKGSIDNIRIWNTARTDQEIKETYKQIIETQLGLVGYWNVAGNETTTIADRASGNPGYLMNGCNYTTPSTSPYLTYSWFPNPDNMKNDHFTFAVNPKVNSTYTVTVIDIDSSFQKGEIRVTVTKNPSSMAISPSIVNINVGESVTLTASIESASCNNSIMLDGKDDYIQVGEKESLIVSNEISIEAWIYPVGTGSSPNYGGIIVNKEGEYEVARFPDGSIQWAFKNSKPGWVFYNTKVIAPLNTWSHIAVTYNSGIVNTYLNGSLANSYKGLGTIGDIVPTQNEFRIGGRQASSQNFSGRIDEVAIWKSVRSEEEIKTDIKFGVLKNSTLIGYWTFNEGSGTLAFDASGKGNNGTLSLGAIWNSTPAPTTLPISWLPIESLNQSEGNAVIASPLVTTTYTATAIDNDGSPIKGSVKVTVARAFPNATFVSKTSGNWSDYTTWQLFDGSRYIDAHVGEIPGEGNPVYLQADHTIALNANASCKDLHLSVTADVIRLNTGENTLDVYGKLRSYTGTVPGTSSTSAGVPNWITTGTNGRIRLKGTTNRVITEKDEFSDHENLKGWTLECDLAEGVVGTINSNFRAGNVIITSGSLEVKSKNFKVSK